MELGIEEVLSDENIQSAHEHLQSKRKTSCGLDGVMISDLGSYWESNKEAIIKQIMAGKYQPGAVSKKQILSSRGKRREIAVMNSVDRLLTRAVAQRLSIWLDPEFSDHCYAYRTGKGVEDAVKQSTEFMRSGKKWVCEIDIKDFFDSIPHEEMSVVIRGWIKDKNLPRLILAYLECEYEEDGRYYRTDKGLIQGSSISPILSNMYLDDLDKYLDDRQYAYFRYGDNINVYTDTSKKADDIRSEIISLLKDKKLRINHEKSGVFLSVNRKCLGYEFEEVSGEIISKRITKREGEVYSRWQKSSVTKIDGEYHLVSDGILTRRDFTILFENDDGKRFIPVEAINGLSVYSSVSFSSSFFEYAAENGLLVSMVNKSGERIGAFIPNNNRRDYRTEIAQIKFRDDKKKGLILAKKYQNANVFNLRAVLRYYERRDEGGRFNDKVLFITEILKKINEAKDYNELMMLEAQARQRYYQCYNLIMQNEDFAFKTRTKRPPKDAINAMISFGNTMLYRLIASEIYNSSLDIRFGILHNSYKRSESLNLDIADLFKPIIVDRAIFTLVNKSMLDIGADFENMDNGGLYLSKSGKRKFIEEFERKLYQKVSAGGRKISYEAIIKNEVRKIEDFYKNGIAYKPYKYVN